jgi:predicted AlkP superfamily phosphohydrolase/phosphomutase
LRFRRRTVEGALAKVFLSYRDADWSRTRAYAYGTWGSIFINLRGREPEGCVDPADYERVREELIADLKQLSDPEDGGPLFSQVLSRDELYEGSAKEYAPDILVIPADDRIHPNALVPFASKRWIGRPISSESGWHRRAGVLVIDGPGVKPGVNLVGKSIEDAGATVFAYLTGALPPDADGKPISEAFDEPLPERETSGVEMAPGAAGPQPYSPEESALIDQRLSNLGY